MQNFRANQKEEIGEVYELIVSNLGKVRTEIHLTW